MAERMGVPARPRKLLYAVNIPLGLYSADWFHLAATGRGSALVDGRGVPIVWGLVTAALLVAACSLWLLFLRARITVLIPLRLTATVLVIGNLELLRQAIQWMLDDGRPFGQFALQGVAWLVWLGLNLFLTTRDARDRRGEASTIA